MRLSLGFDAVWFVEHHFLTSFSMSPYHHPVRGAELQFLMATETVPHDKVMSSIEMFGRHVIRELKKQTRRAPAARRAARACK